MNGRGRNGLLGGTDVGKPGFQHTNAGNRSVIFRVLTLGPKQMELLVPFESFVYFCVGTQQRDACDGNFQVYLSFESFSFAGGLMSTA